MLVVYLLWLVILARNIHMDNCFRLTLKVLPLTQGSRLYSHKNLIVGLNKYSHDASCAVIDGNTGSLLFAQSKERISGRKHDGGATGELVRYALGSIGAVIEDIALVVSNNHHDRVIPFEKQIPLYASLKHITNDYMDPYNLLKHATHLELSHHLAHAYSAVYSSPYSSGVALVMDGMGETYTAMKESEKNQDDRNYFNDLKLNPFIHVPSNSYEHREAESAYYFDNGRVLPIFKRWSREKAPPIYNFGFDYHESLGAVYSRLSSHIFGDWNACGKVMGLSPWANRTLNEAESWAFPRKEWRDLQSGFRTRYSPIRFMSGNPFSSLCNSFSIDWKSIDRLGRSSKLSNKKFGFYSNLASSVQSNLEDCTLQLVKSLSDNNSQNAKNIIFTGGVALNSVLNSKLVDSINRNELSFKNIFIPPAPGDEGVAIGCAYFGFLQHQKELSEKNGFNGEVSMKLKLQAQSLERQNFSPYQGKAFTDEDISVTLSDYDPWISYTYIPSLDDIISSAINDISHGSIIAWFQGRSEFGQRALGARSILADPRIEKNRQIINEQIKEREWFRPLAPSVLSDEVVTWFDLNTNTSLCGLDSPYMSTTAYIKQDKKHLIPAVSHIDGSARLQTVNSSQFSQCELALYYKLILEFFKRTGVPMLLNTSFNRKGKPIVETPTQAVQTFLDSSEELSTLYLGNWKIKRRSIPLFENVNKTMNNKVVYPQLQSITISSVPIYLHESICSGDSDNPIQIRVLTGKDDGGAVNSESEEWICLPSRLHLSILLRVQSLCSSTSREKNQSLCFESDKKIILSDLYDELKLNAEVPFSSFKFIQTLKDLFRLRLVSFEP